MVKEFQIGKIQGKQNLEGSYWLGEVEKHAVVVISPG